MLKKGFAHILPVLIIALLVVTGIAGLSISSDNAQKKAVGKVLSDKDESQKQIAEQAQETAKHDAEKAQEAVKKSQEGQKQPESSGKSPSIKANNETKLEVEKENGKVKIKSKSADSEFESETENGKEKTKLQMEGFKIEIEREGEKFVTKIKNKDGEDAELESSEEAEILDRAEQELEDDDIKIATGSAQLGFIQKGNKVRTNFPLSVNPQTGELFVTTPAGEKVVTILPDQAIDNMVKAGVITRIEQEDESTPPGATASSQTVTNASIELAVQNDKPVYVISGVKDQKFLGLIPVNIKLKTVVSSTDGSLLSINEGFFTRLLDLVSF